MNIYFIRHAESVANRKGIHQGAKYDTDLSSYGVEQARRLFRSKILPKNPTKVISSPLLRARQTAMHALGYTDENFNISFDPRLVERDAGIFNGLNKHDASSLLESRGLTDRFEDPTTEAKDIFIDRLESYLADLRTSMKDGDHVIIFAHGGINRNAGVLLTNYYDYNGELLDHYRMHRHNTGIDHYFIDAQNRIQIKTIGNIDHLL